MLTRALLLWLCLAWPAGAQSYLQTASLAAAQAVSQAQCAALGCDGVHTIYWWHFQPLTTGAGAVLIQPTGAFGPTGLSAPQQAALVSPAALGTKLYTVISVPTFKARFTAPQLAAMTASVDPAVSVPWAGINAGATVNLLNPTIQDMLSAAVNDGIIPSALIILAGGS